MLLIGGMLCRVATSRRRGPDPVGDGQGGLLIEQDVDDLIVRHAPQTDDLLDGVLIDPRTGHAAFLRPGSWSEFQHRRERRRSSLAVVPVGLCYPRHTASALAVGGGGLGR